MTMQGLAEAYLALIHNAAPDEWENAINPEQHRSWQAYDLLWRAFKAQAQRVIDGETIIVAPTAPPSPPGSVTLAAPSEVWDAIKGGMDRKQWEIGTRSSESVGETYEDWEKLAIEADRDVPSFVRTWFRDVGGWDRSSPEDRVQLYQKARAYHNTRSSDREPGEIDTSRCPRCGEDGDEKNRRDGGTFYVCPNDECGFMGDDGWVSTKWDDENWLERREQYLKFKNKGRGGGRGGRRPAGRGGYGGRR